MKMTTTTTTTTTPTTPKFVLRDSTNRQTRLDGDGGNYRRALRCRNGDERDRDKKNIIDAKAATATATTTLTRDLSLNHRRRQWNVTTPTMTTTTTAASAATPPAAAKGDGRRGVRGDSRSNSSGSSWIFASLQNQIAGFVRQLEHEYDKAGYGREDRAVRLFDFMQKIRTTCKETVTEEEEEQMAEGEFFRTAPYYSKKEIDREPLLCLWRRSKSCSKHQAQAVPHEDQNRSDTVLRFSPTTDIAEMVSTVAGETSQELERIWNEGRCRLEDQESRLRVLLEKIEKIYNGKLTEAKETMGDANCHGGVFHTGFCRRLDMESIVPYESAETMTAARRRRNFDTPSWSTVSSIKKRSLFQRPPPPNHHLYYGGEKYVDNSSNKENARSLSCCRVVRGMKGLQHPKQHRVDLQRKGTEKKTASTAFTEQQSPFRLRTPTDRGEKGHCENSSGKGDVTPSSCQVFPGIGLKAWKEQQVNMYKAPTAEDKDDGKKKEATEVFLEPSTPCSVTPICAAAATVLGEQCGGSNGASDKKDTPSETEKERSPKKPQDSPLDFSGLLRSLKDDDDNKQHRSRKGNGDKENTGETVTMDTGDETTTTTTAAGAISLAKFERTVLGAEWRRCRRRINDDSPHCSADGALARMLQDGVADGHQNGGDDVCGIATTKTTTVKTPLETKTVQATSCCGRHTDDDPSTSSTKSARSAGSASLSNDNGKIDINNDGFMRTGVTKDNPSESNQEREKRNQTNRHLQQQDHHHQQDQQQNKQQQQQRKHQHQQKEQNQHQQLSNDASSIRSFFDPREDSDDNDALLTRQQQQKHRYSASNSFNRILFWQREMNGGLRHAPILAKLDELEKGVPTACFQIAFSALAAGGGNNENLSESLLTLLDYVAASVTSQVIPVAEAHKGVPEVSTKCFDVLLHLYRRLTATKGTMALQCTQQHGNCPLMIRCIDLAVGAIHRHPKNAELLKSALALLIYIAESHRDYKRIIRQEYHYGEAELVPAVIVGMVANMDDKDLTNVGTNLVMMCPATPPKSAEGPRSSPSSTFIDSTSAVSRSRR